MPFTVEQITSQDQWEQYVLSRQETNFLHSANWADFQAALGKKVFLLGIFNSGQQVGAILVVKEAAKRGSYLAIAGGPLIDWDKLSIEQLKEIFAYLKQLAKQEHCLFVRFRPQALDTEPLRTKLSKLGVRPAPMHLTADLTLQLDLQQSEEAILTGMRKNTRYEVRKSDKDQLTTKTSNRPEDIQEFYDHQVALAAKHHFVPFTYQFLYEQFRIFAADEQALLISSYQGNELLATAYVLFYNGEAVYHYGISTPANDRLPGSYAAQWAAIKEAKQRGCRSYNFWGIAPKEDTRHRFAGVSTFKRGFGGEEVAYLPAHDLPVSPFYQLTYLFETARKKFRHL